MGPSTGYQNRAISFFSHPSCFLACWKACRGPSHRTSASPQGEEGAGSAYVVIGKQTVQPIIKQQGQSQHGSQASSPAPGSCHTAVLDFWGFSRSTVLPFYTYAFKQQVIITVNPFPTELALCPLLKASKASHLKSTDTY